MLGLLKVVLSYNDLKSDYLGKLVELFGFYFDFEPSSWLKVENTSRFNCSRKHYKRVVT